MTYRGYLEGTDISDFICASFMREPRVCVAWEEGDLDTSTFSSDKLNIVQEFHAGEFSHSNVKVIIIVVVCILLVLQVTFLIWYRVRKHN